MILKKKLIFNFSLQIVQAPHLGERRQTKMIAMKQLAQQVQKLIKTNVFDFQRFLSQKQIFEHPEIIKVISDILASPGRTHEEKTLAATSLRFILIKRVNENYQLHVMKCFQSYFKHFLERDSNDSIKWKYLCLTNNAFKYIIAEIQENLLETVIQKFHSTTFIGKVMLMENIKNNEQISQKNQFQFFRETIEDFIKQILCFLRHIHSSDQLTYENVLIQHDIIMVLFEWLYELKNHTNEEYKQILDFLARNEDLLQIIKEELKVCIQFDQERIKYLLSDEVIALFDSNAVGEMNDNQNRKILSLLIGIKSYTISILDCLAITFLANSEIDEFDTYKTLRLMQLITPILLKNLEHEQILQKQYNQNQTNDISQAFKSLLISIFCLLKRSSSFLFMMQFFQQHKSSILYFIFTNFLRTTDDELELYKNYGEQFLESSDAFVEKGSEDYCDTPKEACGLFMEMFFNLIVNAQYEYVQYLSHCLRYRILHQESQVITDVQQKGYKIPSAEQVYVLLTRIYVFSDKSNAYFLDYVGNNFIKTQLVFYLSNLQKSRFFIFLQYAYGQYFSDNVAEGSKYIELSFQGIDENDTKFEILIQLLRNTFEYGVAENVWEYLVKSIESTEKAKILSLIRKLLEDYINKISTKKLIELSTGVANRIKKEFLDNKQHFKHPGGDYDMMYKCFHIAQILSENKELINKQGQILQQVLQIVDFFFAEDIQNYEFNTEVMKLLNNIIEIQESIPVEFQRYLPTMSRIVTSNKSYGDSLQTYYLILLKGMQAFELKPHFLESIKQSIEQKLLSPLDRTHSIIIQSIFLLQNIYLVYPHLIKENRDVHQATLQIFQMEKQSKQPNAKLVASILLFWLSGEFAFGDYNIAALNQCKIQIFVEEFGLMFALNLRKLIQKYHQTESLADLLKLSLKLLDFQHHYKSNIRYKGPAFTLPIFKKYLFLDSFQQINNAILFLKQNLSKQKYVECLQMLKNQIGEQVLRQLLKIRIFENRKERNIVTVKRI